MALDSGLQRERTVLAWSRTSLAMFANGGLVLVRHDRAFPMPLAVALAGVWVTLGVLVLAYSRRRGRLVSTPDHRIRPAGTAFTCLAVAIAVLAVASAVALVLA